MQKNVYIAADVHLGAPSPEASRRREAHLISWLDEVAPAAAEILLLGDLFDFWFEYQRVVPKGYVRLLGKLAELSDAGLPITLFAGNHDLWYGDYFPRELGIAVQHSPLEREWFGRRYFLAHGDGLGPGDQGYKLMRRVFVHPLSRWLFRWLHPDLGIRLAERLSKTSRNATGQADQVDHGENEFLLQFAREHAADHPQIDHYVFGHRHRRYEAQLPNEAHLQVLGDWLRDFSYLEICDTGPRIAFFPMEHHAVARD